MPSNGTTGIYEGDCQFSQLRSHPHLTPKRRNIRQTVSDCSIRFGLCRIVCISWTRVWFPRLASPVSINPKRVSSFACVNLGLVINRTSSLPVELGKDSAFPDPRKADARGLVAVGGDLTLDRLLTAYRQSIFPWTVNPITWWSPDPRGIIELDSVHVPKSLAKLIRKQTFEVTIDQAFPAVMKDCATLTPKRTKSWITPEFLKAYTQLHHEGHAHSVECWRRGELVGGVYGVSVGGLFAGESMFHRVNNSSKVVLLHLVEHLRSRQFSLFDIQMVTPVTLQVGANDISRSEYLKRLEVAVGQNCSF